MKRIKEEKIRIKALEKNKGRKDKEGGNGRKAYTKEQETN